MRDKIVTLAASDYELALCPEGGGCMTTFRYRGIDVLRPATNEYWQNYEPRASASFPLVPFSNRIADGRTIFEGQSYQFPINMPPEPHTIHGDGWLAAWSVETQESARAILTHKPKNTPFAYTSRQIFELSDDGLKASLEITNASDNRIPVGFGHHPYFPRTDDLSLKMPLSKVWMPDERGIPARKVSVPDEWDFSSAKRLAPLTELDHDFTEGKVGMALNWPSRGLSLDIDADDAFRHVVVFVPPDRDYVCVEPVTHVANAVNMLAAGDRDTGLQILNPDETLQASMWFSAKELV